MKWLKYVLGFLAVGGIWAFYSLLQKIENAQITGNAIEHGGKHSGGKADDSKSATPESMAPRASYMQIEFAMVKAPIGPNTAGYMTIHNTGQLNDRLISVACVFAGRVEIHDHIEEAGVMKMRRIDKLDIPAGKKVILAPAGKHIMFFDVQREALQEGKTVTLTLEFSHAGMIEVQCPVQAITEDTASVVNQATPVVKTNAG